MIFNHLIPFSRIVLLTLICAATASRSVAQVDTSSLRITVEEFIGHIAAGNLARTVDYLPEEVFELADKAQIVAAIEMTMADPTTAPRMGAMTIDSIGASFEDSSGAYALVYYGYTMHLPVPEDVRSDSSSLQLMAAMLENSLGSRPEFKPQTSEFRILGSKRLLGILSDKTPDWKLIEFAPQQMGMIRAVLPEATLNELQKLSDQ